MVWLKWSKDTCKKKKKSLIRVVLLLATNTRLLKLLNSDNIHWLEKRSEFILRVFSCVVLVPCSLISVLFFFHFLKESLSFLRSFLRVNDESETLLYKFCYHNKWLIVVCNYQNGLRAKLTPDLIYRWTD